MSAGNSKRVTSNQPGLHYKLPGLVAKHLSTVNQKPFNLHTQKAFSDVQQWLGDWQGPLILDACCGVGESTAVFAQRFPHARVIGVDKSLVRVNKHQNNYDAQASNYFMVRADLKDFWRLAIQAGWQLWKHYILYPNPYPKSSHLRRRWHAGPEFRDIVRLGGELTVRSNWDIYIKEFAWALDMAGFQCEALVYQAEEPISPFERKYWNSGQHSWQLQVNLSK